MIGSADYRGNRQYVAVGNVSVNDRVSIIMVDHPSRTRLKLSGHAREVCTAEVDRLATLAATDYPARIERGVVIHVDGFDLNCPQHITPRYTLAQIESAVAPLKERIAKLEAQLRKRSNSQQHLPADVTPFTHAMTQRS